MAITDDVRSGIARHERPMPEYLLLERDFGVELVDWRALGLLPGRRSIPRSLNHALFALRHSQPGDAIFSDGEHVGIPLALALRLLRRSTPHVMIGHNLLNPRKRNLLSHVGLRPFDRVIVHSGRQVDGILSGTRLSAKQIAVVPYGIDTEFWSSGGCIENDEKLIVSAGREHRDYETLVAALPARVRLTIADHSPFTPAATRRDPASWPAHVERIPLDYGQLRQLYARASIVVVPLIESFMPAGITTLLEAMSMGKPVIVSGTRELSGVVTDGRSGLVVPPGDVGALRTSIARLLASPTMREALGGQARRDAVERHDVRGYTSALAYQIAGTATRGW